MNHRDSAPDSPRSSQSPPPSGNQGDLELELLGLATALYNLGTTVINDSTKERDKPGGGKQVGLRVYAPHFLPKHCFNSVQKRGRRASRHSR